MFSSTVNSPEDLAERLKVQVPLGESGGVIVERFEFGKQSPWDRPTPRPREGQYTGLRKAEDPGRWWMSDMPNEVFEHMEFLMALQRAPRNSSILILGLGLGLGLHGALLMRHQGPIDVVEKDGRVLALMQEHYEWEARICRAEVRFHLADAYTWEPPNRETYWHLGYADVFRDMIETNLQGIARLRKRFEKRCLWFGAWSEREALWLKGEREAGRVVPGVPVAHSSVVG